MMLERAGEFKPIDSPYSPYAWDAEPREHQQMCPIRRRPQTTLATLVLRSSARPKCVWPRNSHHFEPPGSPEGVNPTNFKIAWAVGSSSRVMEIISEM